MKKKHDPIPGTRVLAIALLAASISGVTASAQVIETAGNVFNVSNPVPANPPSPWNLNTLWVGKQTNSVGSVIIRQGASALPTFTVVGGAAGASGLLRISDVGSNLTSANGFLVVGSNGGQGQLEILNGGRLVAVTADLSFAGENLPGSNGVALIRGAGSLLRATDANSASTLSLRHGCSSLLSIEEGGWGDFAGDLRLAAWTTGDMGHAVAQLSGAGSRISVGGRLWVGQAATGSARMNVGTGTTVSAASGYAIGRTGVVELSGGTFGQGIGVLSTNDGALRGWGSVSGNLTNNAAGSIEVAAGKELQLFADRSADAFINRGRVANFGGTFSLALPGSNQPGGQIVGRDARFILGEREAGNAFLNLGQIAFTGGQNDVVGPINNGSRILVDNNSTVTFASNVTNNSELRVTPGSRAIFLGSLSGNGVIGGGASLAMSQVSPGGSGTASTMGFDGTLTIDSAAGELKVDLVSSVADRVVVSQTAIVGGTLSLAVSGSAPSLYESRRVIDAASLAGRFTRVNGVQVSGTNIGLATSYDAQGLSIIPALLGDADLDREVKFDDLLIVAQHYDLQKGQTWFTGDFNGDGAVVFDDLLTLAQHYGQTMGDEQISLIQNASPGFAADWAMAKALVPEPISLMGLALPFMICRKRTR